MSAEASSRAVIFDMDGVIVDSERQWKTLEGFFLKSLVPEWSSEHQNRIIGLSVHDLYRMLRDEHGISHTEEEFLEWYHRMATDIYSRRVSLIEGFPQLLKDLRQRGVRLALASSSPMKWIDIVLERFDLRSAFPVVVSSDELEGEGKPSPAIYLLTARKLGAPPERCAVIEDSQNGVLSARRAGMFCVGFRNGFNEDQDLSAANVIVHGFGEISAEELIAA